MGVSLRKAEALLQVYYYAFNKRTEIMLGVCFDLFLCVIAAFLSSFPIIHYPCSHLSRGKVSATQSMENSYLIPETAAIRVSNNKLQSRERYLGGAV